MQIIKKKRVVIFFIIILIVLSLAINSNADSYAPDQYDYRIRYSTGTEIQTWTVECDTDPNDDSDDSSSGFFCSVDGLGSPINPLWCEEESTVQIQWQMYHEPDVGLPYENTTTVWKDMYLIDWDGDMNDCACYIGAGRYDVGGEILQCCGDDTDEYYISESDSPLNDSVPSDACCDNTTDCVDDDSCYSTSDFKDIGEPDERGNLPPTGDLEKCENSVWHDADESKAYCDMPGFGAAGCWDGTDSSCWRNEGETSNFGGYENSIGKVQYGCCGDDSGEYYIVTDYSNDACCNAPDDFVFSDGECESAENRRYIYGQVFGMQQDGTYAPLVGALVQAVDPFDGSIVNENYTGNLGYYNLSVINGLYDLLFRPPKEYEGATFTIYVYDENIRKDYYADRLSYCLPDCTRYDLDFSNYYCDEDCDGINHCYYNSSIVSDFSNPAFYGKTMKELCDDLESGWTVPHNSTHDILCCNKGYILKPENTEASLDLSGNYQNIESFFAGLVSYYGKFVSIWIAIGED